jgi:methyl-accepting chemotaxis protein
MQTIQRPRVIWLTGNPLLRLPIAVQLTLGFVVAALIAASAAAIPNLQRAQTLQNQTSFYQFFISKSTLPASANQDLQNIQANIGLINTTTSQETLYNAVQALDGAANDFATTVTAYAAHDLVAENPAQQQFLAAAGHAQDSAAQQTQAQTLVQDWQLYAALQNVIVQPLKSAATKAADGTAIIPQTALTGAIVGLAQGRATPAIIDVTQAYAALNALNGQIVGGIALQSTTAVAGQQVTVTTLLAIALAVIGIALVGLFISNTLVRRLAELRRVTLAVEEGQFGERTRVAGRDELARVSTSVNGMLDTIVGLLEETRRQRDALTQAADSLFSDMRMVERGDLRVNARVSNDPVGMLSNAFNLTIGRFRRFILRMQTTLNQLDTISRREQQRAQTFIATLRGGSQPLMSTAVPWEQSSSHPIADPHALMARARELVYYTAQEGATGQMKALLDHAEEAYLSVARMQQIVSSLPEARSPGTVTRLAQMLGQEVAVVEAKLRQMGTAAFMAQKTTTVSLNELNITLERATALMRMPGVTSGGDASNGMASLSVQVMGGFAQEIAELAAELAHVVQDMHASLGSFRVENNEAMQGSGFGMSDYYPGR